MNSRLLTGLLALIIAGLAGCSTPDDRISRDQTLFNAFPPEIQAKIRAGDVAMGFNPEMVYLALGEPDRKFTHYGPTGPEEVWIYRSHEPVVSFGFGVGSVGRASAVSAGIGTSNYEAARGERLRVIFQNAVVTAIETIKR